MSADGDFFTTFLTYKMLLLPPSPSYLSLFLSLFLCTCKLNIRIEQLPLTNIELSQTTVKYSLLILNEVVSDPYLTACSRIRTDQDLTLPQSVAPGNRQ